MKSRILMLLGLLAISYTAAQTNFSNDPLDAKFVTEDVDRFWEAFYAMEEGKNPFISYIDNGTPGLKGFMEYRIINADSLHQMVLHRKDDYLAAKDVLQGLEEKKKRIRAIYAAMKYWYPEAQFPPIYFVMGRFNSGGTVSEDGVILGVEMMRDLEGLPGLVAHELIHYQQRFPNETLLVNAIKEGSADFIGELISGNHINPVPFAYGERHIDRLCKEFVLLMDKDDNADWLFGNLTGRDDRPNDLGYWMGYKITEAYFEKQADKKQAIVDILTLKEPKEFLRQSGFLDKYIKEVYAMTEAEIAEFLRPYSKETYSVTIVVKVPDAKDEVYITGGLPQLGEWNPGKIKLNKKSEYERTITLDLNSPAQFKFTRGSWASEGFVEDYGSKNIDLASKETKAATYTISGWKDRE